MHGAYEALEIVGQFLGSRPLEGQLVEQGGAGLLEDGLGRDGLDLTPHDPPDLDLEPGEVVLQDARLLVTRGKPRRQRNQGLAQAVVEVPGLRLGRRVEVERVLSAHTAGIAEGEHQRWQEVPRRWVVLGIGPHHVETPQRSNGSTFGDLVDDWPGGRQHGSGHTGDFGNGFDLGEGDLLGGQIRLEGAGTVLEHGLHRLVHR